jgi:hypothetical protein
MLIPEILKQIDAEIARLKQVRNILAGETSVPQRKTKRALLAEAPQQTSQPKRQRRAAEKTPVVTVLEPVTRRTRTSQPKAVAAASTALTASVPNGPVAVRAADVPVRALVPAPAPRRGILDAANFLN